MKLINFLKIFFRIASQIRYQIAGPEMNKTMLFLRFLLQSDRNCHSADLFPVALRHHRGNPVQKIALNICFSAAKSVNICLKRKKKWKKNYFNY
jgi:hypothetical protein